MLVVDISKADGNTKVSEFDGAARCDEEVGAFDVAVDDTLIMKVAQSFEDLIDVVCSQLL